MSDAIEFSDEERAKLVRRAIQFDIDALEKRQDRAFRELFIGRGGTPDELKKRLEDIDDKITALRAQLT